MISKELEEFIKDETKAFEERLRTKAEELQEQIPDKPKTIWDLDMKDGERYYYLSSNGVIGQGIFNTCYDKGIRALGNTFLTREEAEFELERRKIETIMKKYSRPFKCGGNNYYIYYDYAFDGVVIDVYHTVTDGVSYFESEEIVQKVIDEIGKNRLKKYWFGVKDE